MTAADSRRECVLSSTAWGTGEGGRFRALLASGDLPCLMGLVLRSIGALGEAGEDSRDLPTGPIGEHVRSFELVGEEGGRIDELRRSRGVMGDLIGVLRRGETCTTWDFVSGEGLTGE